MFIQGYLSYITMISLIYHYRPTYCSSQNIKEIVDGYIEIIIAREPLGRRRKNPREAGLSRERPVWGQERASECITRFAANGSRPQQTFLSYRGQLKPARSVSPRPPVLCHTRYTHM